MRPGCPHVTIFCLVRHIPDWLPWFSYKPLARVGRDLGLEVLHPPIDFVKDAMVSWQQSVYFHTSRTSHNLLLEAKGTAQPSLTLENLQRIEKLSERERVNAEDVVIGASGSIYAGSELSCILR